jgi:hypothetical protein
MAGGTCPLHEVRGLARPAGLATAFSAFRDAYLHIYAKTKLLILAVCKAITP